VPAFRGMANAIRMAEVEVERYENDLGLCSLLRDPWERQGTVNCDQRTVNSEQ
jgi:hypothetical protein